MKLLHQISLLTVLLVSTLVVVGLWNFGSTKEHFSDEEIDYQISGQDETPEFTKVRATWRVSKEMALYVNRNRLTFEFGDKAEWKNDGLFQIVFESWLTNPANHRLYGVLHEGKKMVWIDLWSGPPPRSTNHELWLPTGLILDPDSQAYVSLNVREVFSDRSKFL